MKILMSDVTIPILDDPISKNELAVAIGNMKKGGYDHRVGICKTIVNFMSPLILLLLIKHHVLYMLPGQIISIAVECNTEKRKFIVTE